MEASKLVISAENLRFKPMSRGKRSQLRKENIKALIRSRPAGSKITSADFQAVTGAKYQTIWSMLNSMIRKGEITRTPMPGKTKLYSWVVNEDVKVTKPSVDEAPSADKQDTPERSQPDEHTATDKTPSSLLVSAKDFAWETNSDSLREFVQWYELAEKYNLGRQDINQ